MWDESELTLFQGREQLHPSVPAVLILALNDRKKEIDRVREKKRERERDRENV